MSRINSSLTFLVLYSSMNQPLEIPGFVYDPVRKRYFKITNASSGITDSRYSNSTIEKKKRLSKRTKKPQTSNRSNTTSSPTKAVVSSSSIELSTTTANPYVDTLERHRLRLLGCSDYNMGSPLVDLKVGIVLTEELRSLRLFYMTGFNQALDNLERGNFKWNWHFKTNPRVDWKPCFRLVTVWPGENTEFPMEQYFYSRNTLHTLDRLETGRTDVRFGDNIFGAVRYSGVSNTNFLVRKFMLNVNDICYTMAFDPLLLSSSGNVVHYSAGRVRGNSPSQTKKIMGRYPKVSHLQSEDKQMQTNTALDASENKLAIGCLFEHFVSITDSTNETLIHGFDTVHKDDSKVLQISLGDKFELHTFYSNGLLVLFNWKTCAFKTLIKFGPNIGVPEAIWYNWLGFVVIIDNVAVRIVQLAKLSDSNKQNEQDSMILEYAEIAKFKRNTLLLSRSNGCYQNQRGDYLMFYEGFDEANGTSTFMLINVRYQLMKRLLVKCGPVTQFLFVPPMNMDPPRLVIVTRIDNKEMYMEGIFEG